MTLTDTDRALIRQSSKDDAAYQRLLTLFEQRPAPPQTYWGDIAFEHSPDALLIADDDSRYVAANAAACRLLGYSRDALLTQSVFDLTPPEDRDEGLRAWRQLMEEGSLHGRVSARHADGHDVLVEYSAVANVAPGWHFFVLRDRTAEQVLQQQLSDSLRRFQSLFETSAVGMALVSLEGIILQANEAAVQMMGRTPTGLVGVNFRELSHPDHLDESVACFMELTQGETETYRLEKRYLRPDGSSFWSLLDVSLVRDEDGAPSHCVAVLADITRRKQAEQALRQREGEFRALVENNPDSVQRVTRDGRFLYVNRAMAQRHGYTPEAIIGKTNEEVSVDPALRAYLDDARERVFQTGQEGIVEFNWETPDGQRHFQVRLTPEFDEQGQVATVLGIGRDITEMRRTEEALRASEARYRTIAEHFPNGLLALYDHELRYTVVNGRGLADIGLTPADLEGKRLRDVFPPEVYERDEPALLAALRGEQTESEVQLGNRFYRVMTVPVLDDDGGVIYGLVMSQDITEQRKAKLALAESEERYRSILAAMSEGVVMHDAEGRIVLCNAAATAILGQSERHIIGATSDDPRWNAVAEDGTPLPGDAHPAMITLRTGQPGYRSIMGIDNPDLGRRWISVNTQPLMTPDEVRPHGVVATFSDITLERQRQQQQFDLALERERIRILSGFMQDASHEFRTPLSVISTSAYLLASQSGNPESRHLGKIEWQIKRLTRLVDTLLLMARLDAGLPMTMESTSVSKVVQRALKHVKDTGEGSQVTVEVDIMPPNLRTLGHTVNLPLALAHLLENALRFSPPGSQVTLKARLADDTLQIAVQDSGPGVPPDDLPHIFKRFWRQDKAHSEDGFGLGLPIARKIIEMHSGTITVSNPPEGGACFTVTLPALPSPMWG